MTVLSVGDRVKVIGLSALSGKTGSVAEKISDKTFRVKLDSTGSVLMFFISELELVDPSIDGFKVGDKVGFDNWNDVWKGGEGVVVELLDKGRGLDPDLKIVVELTKLPPLNNFYPVGDRSAWSSKHLNHLVEIPFKVGDKVTWDYNDHWDDGEGVVTAIDPHDRLPVQVKVTKKPSLNVLYDVGYTSNWQVKNLKPLPEKKKNKFKEGDKVGFSGDDRFLRGAEGEVIDSWDSGNGVRYLVKLSKVNATNLILVKDSTVWWEEGRLHLIEKPKVEAPKGLDTQKLSLKPLGSAVEDKEGRAWVLVGQQYYVHKAWDGIESLHAASLVKKYGPITERVK